MAVWRGFKAPPENKKNDPAEKKQKKRKEPKENIRFSAKAESPFIAHFARFKTCSLIAHILCQPKSSRLTLRVLRFFI
jgi:hypothetical protein